MALIQCYIMLRLWVPGIRKECTAFIIKGLEFRVLEVWIQIFRDFKIWKSFFRNLETFMKRGHILEKGILSHIAA